VLPDHALDGRGDRFRIRVPVNLNVILMVELPNLSFAICLLAAYGLCL
jgi:hypothetical protein